MNQQNPIYPPALHIAMQALDKLSILGNGDHIGNSKGNVIARDAILQINRIILTQNQPVVDIAEDALAWGSALNDAGWAATEHWNNHLSEKMSGQVFNNLKGIVRVGVLTYLEKTQNPTKKQPNAVTPLNSGIKE